VNLFAKEYAILNGRSVPGHWLGNAVTKECTAKRDKRGRQSTFAIHTA